MSGSAATLPSAGGTPDAIGAEVSVRALTTINLAAGDVVLAAVEGRGLREAGDRVLGGRIGRRAGRGACAASDPLLMMRPPRGSWLFMMRNASCVQRNIPVRFTATTCFHCSYVRSSSGARGPAVPALLKRTSTRP